MRTKCETREFLENLQWKRMTKNDLQKELREFFDSDNFIEESTDEDDKNVDYSIVFTIAKGDYASSNYIDIEIWYLPMRNGEILITGSEILDYKE